MKYLRSPEEIAGTPEGDAMRKMHERKGFIASEPAGIPTNLT